MDALPLAFPLHESLVVARALEIGVGCESVKFEVVEQLLAV